jgi:Ran GTPase-activating protein (RanGAP) involved in mRNA processing and transport
LNKLTKLEHVDLADSSFSEDNVPVIVEVLSKQSKLSYLNIRDGGLESEGVDSLASSLAEAAPPLVFLDISGNDASEESLGPIGELLNAVADTLEEFTMDDSEINDIDAIKEHLIPVLSKVYLRSGIVHNLCILTY